MTRRGVALILVLATLLAIASAVSVSAMSAANASRDHIASTQSRRTSDMLNAAEPIVERWLRTKSVSAVVDPNASMPMVPVAAFEYESGAEQHHLEITAWDLEGMIPHNLDPEHSLWESVNEPVDFFGVNSLSDIADPLLPVHPSLTNETIGGRIAVVPDTGMQRSSTPMLVNVNTAPLPLLRAAARLTHSTELGQIIENRNAGIATITASHGHSDTVRLVTRGSLWAIRVDARAGSVTRSWWTVYEDGGRGWSIIERHEIAD